MNDPFWNEKVEWAKSDYLGKARVVRIRQEEGIVHYVANPYGNYVMRGFCGEVFYFKMHDGTYVKSNNVWHQGTVPKEYESSLPENAVRITEQEYLSALGEGLNDVCRM